ncbi:MAG: GC-type dockerin domain-anchored protein [Phycisphaerales bacterium]|nr:GC-type dockerin domain-anchored protein [Phycisphaerales bacterium]
MRSALAVAALCTLCGSALAQPFHYAINQPASSLSYNINFTAPFQTSPAGSSYFVGAAAGPDAVIGNADDNPALTRTIPGFSGGDVNTNQYVNLTSGNISASGNNGTTVIRPSGSYDAAFNTVAGTVAITNLNTNLLGGSTAAITANATIGYSTFRTRVPTCTVFSFGPITVPVGTINATSITGVQNGPSTNGALTPVNGQPGHYTFSAMVPAAVTVTGTLNGAPAPFEPQNVTLAVTGTVDLTQPSAPVTAQITVNETQTDATPVPLDPIAFNEVPLCTGAALLIKLTLASTSTTIGLTANLTAAGTLTACGPADIGRQGGVAGADGLLNNNDFVVFIDYFFNSNPLADRGTTGGVPGTDGQYDNNDFIVFIDQFFAGCN